MFLDTDARFGDIRGSLGREARGVTCIPHEARCPKAWGRAPRNAGSPGPKGAEGKKERRECSRC